MVGRVEPVILFQKVKHRFLHDLMVYLCILLLIMGMHGSINGHPHAFMNHFKLIISQRLPMEKTNKSKSHTQIKLIISYQDLKILPYLFL